MSTPQITEFKQAANHELEAGEKVTLTAGLRKELLHVAPQDAELHSLIAKLGPIRGGDPFERQCFELLVGAYHFGVVHGLIESPLLLHTWAETAEIDALEDQHEVIRNWLYEHGCPVLVLPEAYPLGRFLYAIEQWNSSKVAHILEPMG